ncbi:alpha/beta hydrolase family protein [Leptobacterium sp. I13]|uniref:alpha/beta hydrolase family protein n=1 Tax=Leptobacterium meishanense TaxID=3128904 RepID=UPI0030ED393D
MIIKKNIVIEGAHKRSFLLDVFLKNNSSSLPLVIFCHGYKGFKDWGCWDLVAQRFAAADYCFIKFNFSHNGGTVENPIDFPDLNAFAENNYIKELTDLDVVINWLCSTEFPFAAHINTSNISLIGHSRGGGIVTIKAAEDHKIKNIVSWAGVSDYSTRFPKGEKLAEWKELGVMYVENARTKQQMPHNYQFYENFKANESRLNIQSASEKLNIPHLIIHGNTDNSVSINEAKALHRWNSKSELCIIQRANHVFGGNHPWKNKNLPDALGQVVEKTIDFLK